MKFDLEDFTMTYMTTEDDVRSDYTITGRIPKEALDYLKTTQYISLQVKDINSVVYASSIDISDMSRHRRVSSDGFITADKTTHGHIDFKYKLVDGTLLDKMEERIDIVCSIYNKDMVGLAYMKAIANPDRKMIL